MSQPIDPVRRSSSDRRSGERRSDDRRAPAPVKGGLPVPVSAARPEPRGEPDPGAAVFAAQLMGQTGQKRGLKGGPPVLEAARSTYLETEWRGPGDRRVRAGRITKTEI